MNFLCIYACGRKCVFGWLNVFKKEKARGGKIFAVGVIYKPIIKHLEKMREKQSIVLKIDLCFSFRQNVKKENLFNINVTWLFAIYSKKIIFDWFDLSKSKK